MRTLQALEGGLGENERRLGELLSSALSGNVAALEKLLLAYHDPLLAFIKSYLHKNPFVDLEPEDVLQETMIEAFRNASTIEGRGSDAFFGWLKAIARTRCINLAKAKQAQKRGGQAKRILHSPRADETATSILNLLAAPDPTPSYVARKKEAVEVIAQALAGLKRSRQRVMELRFGQGLSVEQIAKLTGKKPGSIKMLIHRTIQELRKVVGPNSEVGV